MLWWGVSFLIYRLLEIISYKIHSIQKEDTLLENLTNTSATAKTYRVEETPKDEVTLAEDEMIIPVAHFHKVRSLLLCRIQE